ncbi:MFS transporter [Oscillospiraceae bacterium PP1C4]
MEQKLFTKDFTFLIVGQTVSMLGTAILKFTISLYILDLTDSATMFGLITAISYIPPIFLSVFGGILADRKNKRNLMILLDLSYSVIAIGISLVIANFQSLGCINILLVLISVISSFETPVVQSSIPLIQPKNKLVKANAVVNQVNMLAGLIGPLAAGVLYGFLGAPKAVLIIFSCGICFFTAAAIESLLIIPFQKPKAQGKVWDTIKHDITEAFCFIGKDHPHIMKTIYLNTVFVFLIQPLITVGAPYIINVNLGLNSIWNGTSQMLMGGAGIIGGIIAGLIPEKFTIKKLNLLFVAIGAALFPLSFAVLLNAAPKTVYFILNVSYITILILASIAGVFLMSAIQKEVPTNMLGRVMSLYSTMVSCALPLGMALYGIVFDCFSSSLYLILLITALMIMAVGFGGKKIYLEFDNKTEKLI